ncbi:MAG TPA: hypothetical protein VEI97_04355, partial [bacterium]|nr:hypothetical protein [bacterium]
LPEFNRKEAWEVSAQVTANALMAANVNSTASLTIYAKDWQQNAVVAPSWPATNSSQVRAPSRVAKVLIDVPGLMAPMERTTPTGGQGSDSFPLRYEVTVYNELAAPEGTYTALVAVRDELSVSPGGGPLPLPAGITRGTPLDIRDYTTYITVPLEVAAASGAELADPLPYPIIFATTEPVTWPGSIAATTGNFGYAPTGDPGTGNLWRLDPDGTLTNLTSFYRAVVRRPMISYDGTRIAFSAKIGDGSAPWQVYTMDLDGQNLSNLSRNSHNDFDPDWLPDGRLVFCSDRIPNWNDPYALTQTAQLFTMDSDGRNVERLTYSPSGDYWPVVLRDGRISFRRWDNLRINIERHSGPLHGVPYGFPENFGMNDINGGNIWVCNPDGTNVDLHYGSHLTRNRRTFNDHTELPDGRMLAIAAPFSDTWGAGTVALLDPAEYDNVEVPFYWTEPEAAAPGPAATGRYRFPAALADGRAVAVYAPGPLYYTGTPFEPDFGLVLITQTGEKRALVDQPGVWEWSPVEARPRPTPATIPAIDNPDQNWGLLACGNVFLRDAREPESKDPQPIPPVAPGYKVRFYQGVISDSVGLFDPPAPAMPVLRPHRYLGEAPVASDGSFAAMLPAHQPITWQLVNAQNKVVVTERFYTSLEGGETRTCQGCHAPQRPGAFVPRNPTEFVALENPTDLR